MELVVVLVLLVLVLMGLMVWGAFRRARRRTAKADVHPAPADSEATEDSTYRISYVPPEFEWSGHTQGALPIKILTYKQYECLEDARYGFRIVGLPPTERKLPQPHKTRAHGLKTVSSLVKHGFLHEDGEGAYHITDRGLNALEVCSVRY